jgi:hypothetical protein
MARYDNPLRNVKIAVPCPADWNCMIGDDRVRFCNQCNLNVYNLSGMSKPDAEDLIRRTEERLCVRFYRRTDGTVLTENCPVGLRAIKRRVSKVAVAAFSAILSFMAGLGVQTLFFGSESLDRPTENFVMGAMAPIQPTVTENTQNPEEWTMGKIVMPIEEKTTENNSLQGGLQNDE